MVTLVATSEICNSSGGNIKPTREDAAILATTPDQNPLFVCFVCYFKNRLPVRIAGLYIPVAGVNPSARFSSLNRIAGSRLISDMRFFCARNTILTRLMAGRNGGALALAGFYSASLLTPLRLATPFSSVLARLLKFRIGAANMAISARPQGHTSSHLKSVNKLNKPLFVWRFFSCQSGKSCQPGQSGQQSTYYTVTATSEREARLQLPAVRHRLVFVARIRVEEVCHA
ncbi:host cell division inhibitor Icd-like protein [Salmonella enterica subsp. enterica serovar Sandiego]|nr:host cell division inhibitor Icd-like protein [Salmonella enterica subsp. enterica serovar Sandiego]